MDEDQRQAHSECLYIVEASPSRTSATYSGCCIAEITRLVLFFDHLAVVSRSLYSHRCALKIILGGA